MGCFIYCQILYSRYYIIMHIYIYILTIKCMCLCICTVYIYIHTYIHSIYHIWYIYIINHIWYMIWLRNLICPHILYTKTCPWHDIIFSLTWSSARSRCLQLQAWGFWRSSRNSTIQTGEVDEGARFDPVWNWFWRILEFELGVWQTSMVQYVQWNLTPGRRVVEGKCNENAASRLIQVEWQILMRQVLWGQKLQPS